MDELERFKKEWQKEDKNLPKLSYEEIYKMIWKKSSSSVKWIFIVSLLELSLGIIISIFYHPKFEDELEIPGFVEILSWAAMPVLVYFIYRFFMNYRKISTTSSVKGLLSSIIKARKTVRLYIIVNLILGGIISVITLISVYVSSMGGWDAYYDHTNATSILLLIGLAILLSAIIMGIFLGLYSIIYGYFMRKLSRNYKELKKMELD